MGKIIAIGIFSLCAVFGINFIVKKNKKKNENETESKKPKTISILKEKINFNQPRASMIQLKCRTEDNNVVDFSYLSIGAYKEREILYKVQDITNRLMQEFMLGNDASNPIAVINALMACENKSHELDKYLNEIDVLRAEIKKYKLEHTSTNEALNSFNALVNSLIDCGYNE